jgi:inhibitor of Bruton tyrosine kinase
VLGSSPQNLAEIIAQQTSEQAALTAKAAPRSLKDIQEEERFLQWWERESLRVRREEEIARGKEGEGRGRGRGRGGRDGRGGRGWRGRGGAGLVYYEGK